MEIPRRDEDEDILDNAVIFHFIGRGVEAGERVLEPLEACLRRLPAPAADQTRAVPIRHTLNSNSRRELLADIRSHLYSLRSHEIRFKSTC